MRGFQLREDVERALKDAEHASEDAGRATSAALEFDQVNRSNLCTQETLSRLHRTFNQLDVELVRDVAEQTRDIEEAVMILSTMVVERDDDNADNVDDCGGASDDSDASGDDTDWIKSMWDDMLPMDCKRIIWGMLSSRDMARAAATSREWHEYAQEMRTWRTFLTVQRSLQPAVVEGLVRSHDQAEKLKIDYRKANSATAMDSGVFYRSIRRGQEARFEAHDDKIAFEEGKDCAAAEEDACGGAHDAATADDESPRFHGIPDPLPPKVFRDVLVNSSDACRFDKYELESLLDALEYVENLSIVDSPSIDDESVRFLLGYRTQTRLSFTAFASFTSSTCSTMDALEDEIPPARPLQVLSLLNTRLSNRGFKELILNGGWSTLDVSRNRRITELVSPPVRSPLRLLTARSLPNLTKINLSLGGTNVHNLDLSENHQLSECVITASETTQRADVRQFHELNLAGCKNLRMLMLDCPDLKKLTCSRCRRLQLVGGFVHGLNVPALETLNINACREANDEGVNLLLGKIRLRHLNVGGCIRLTRLQVDFRNAKAGCTLDAYGCRHLGHIEIRGSAALDKLVTAGCGGAEGVRVVKL